jgi:polar amino acid transport system substrate-binding protein
MKKITSILSLVLITVLAMSLFTGCGDKKKVIVMGTNAEFEPFEYMQGGKVVGFDVEIAKKVAEKLGAELKIENMQFASLITSLETKKIDFIAAGMTNNEERAKQVNFSMDYFTASQVIIVNKESDSVKSKADLEGKKIGVQLGTTGETETKSVEGAEVKSYDTGYAAVLDLANGKIDAVVIDQKPAEKFVDKNDKIEILEEELTKEAYAIAVNKEDEELLETINEVIKEIQENGEYDKIYKQFFGEEE